jgi:hypothetical protein
MLPLLTVGQREAKLHGGHPAYQDMLT